MASLCCAWFRGEGVVLLWRAEGSITPWIGFVCTAGGFRCPSAIIVFRRTTSDFEEAFFKGVSLQLLVGGVVVVPGAAVVFELNGVGQSSIYCVSMYA